MAKKLPPETFFLDIDGTVLKHQGNNSNVLLRASTSVRDIVNGPGEELLPGVKEKLDEWHSRGCKVFFTTGRPECMREFTEDQLARFGITYTGLIMDAGCGVRVLVNDLKPSHKGKTAKAVNVERNVGLGGVKI